MALLTWNKKVMGSKTQPGIFLHVVKCPHNEFSLGTTTSSHSPKTSQVVSSTVLLRFNKIPEKLPGSHSTAFPLPVAVHCRSTGYNFHIQNLWKLNFCKLKESKVSPTLIYSITTTTPKSYNKRLALLPFLCIK